jgi:large subunit ribosomal protein L47
MRQYGIPKFMNTSWHKTYLHGYSGYAVQKFLRLYKEKIWNTKRKAKKFVTTIPILFLFLLFKKKSYICPFFFSLDRKRVAMYIRRFPNVDMEALKEQFPHVDIEAAKASRRANGHYIPQ